MVFDQRWTLLVLRELVAGSDRFNDIHRGVPRMSRETADGPVCELTEAGEALLPVMEAIGEWRGDIGWDDAMRGGDLRLHGPEHLRRRVPAWLQLSHFAATPR